MKCIKCSKKAEVKVQNLSSCKSCFLKIIQKRVRKELRLKELIKKNDKILVVNNGSAEAQVTLYLLKEIIKDLPVKINTRNCNYNLGQDIAGNFNKIIIPWNTDLEDEYFLSSIFQNKELKYLGHFNLGNKTYVKLLQPVLQEEVNLYAEIKKFKFSKRKKTIISEMLDKLEKKYPETKFSLLKSSQEL